MGILNKDKEMEAFAKGFSLALEMTHDICERVADDSRKFENDHFRLGAVAASERCVSSIAALKRAG